jgi:glutamyl-tRNA reductase
MKVWNMNLAVVGIHFRTTPVEVREHLSVQPADVPAALARLCARLPHTELLLLSTCNRTELYAVSPDAEVNPDTLIDLLLAGGRDVQESFRECFYRKAGEAALAHLMTVAASLDSMVVGEAEILGQVKQAHAAAVAAGSLGPHLESLVQRAFKVAKRVRAETDLARGHVSVGSVAAELVAKVFEDLRTKTVMIVGAGEVSEQTLKHLVDKGVGDALVLNRSIERSRLLADRYGGTAVSFDRLDEYLSRADIVVSSTGAPHSIISAAAVQRAVTARRNRPVFLIDLAVPRDIQAAAAEIENVYLYNIDDLQKVADENLARRHDAVAAARRIVAEELAAAATLFRAGSLGAVMRRIDAKAERIADTELKRVFAKPGVAPLPGTCDHCREEIRTMLHRALNKMNADTKKALNEAARDGRWDDYAEIMEHLLGVSPKDDGHE